MSEQDSTQSIELAHTATQHIFKARVDLILVGVQHKDDADIRARAEALHNELDLIEQRCASLKFDIEACNRKKAAASAS